MTTTSSGIEALLLLGELQPDAALIDLNMPDLDGFEVLRRVRKFKSLAGVTLVAMTGHHTPSANAMSLKSGAIACLAKPFDAGSVLMLIKRSKSTSTGFSQRAFGRLLGTSQPPRPSTTASGRGCRISRGPR